MSLRVWLPLNGDLHNQGLSDVTVTNNGATVNTSGKIGSCYSFGTTTSEINLSSNAMTSMTTECSVSFWLKIISWNSNYATFFQAGIGSASWAAHYFSFLRNASNSTCCFTISNGSSNSSNSYLTSALELNIWYHISLIYKTGHCLIYINGELYRDYTTSIVPNFSGITVIKLGRSHNTYQTNCLMNDFRIYDHALSELEIKEIARGLILHYPLNNNGMGNKNLLTNDWNLTAWSKESGISVSWDDTVGMYKVLDSSHTSSRWGIYQNITLTANTTYTFSVDGMKKDQNVNFGFAEGTSWPANAGSFTTTVSRLSKTITVGSADANCRIYLNINPVSNGSNYGYFRAPKLEIGSVATPWGSHTDNTIEYDISGYCNNGTKIGTFTYPADTPKYNVSTNLTTTSSHIATTTLTTAGFTNSYSISWWGNVSTYSGKMMWGFSNGNRLNGIYNGNLWNTGDGSSNPLYQPGTTTQVSAPTTNVWHHFVMVGDGTTCKVYKDGELWGQAKTYKSLTGTIIYFNGWANATNYTLENTKLSDFRIYATALSAQDILSLYHNSALVDEQGIIHGAIH